MLEQNEMIKTKQPDYSNTAPPPLNHKGFIIYYSKLEPEIEKNISF